MIDVLVPCLSRPHNAQILTDYFYNNSPVGSALLFLCSPGDDAQIEACRATGESVEVVEWPAGPGDYARKINHGYELTKRPYLLNGSDDIEFTPGWAEEALRNMRPGVCVVATNDMANASVRRGLFGTHCLIRRSYVDEQGGTFDEQPGVVLWEGYDHNYVDRELCELAKGRGCYAFAKRSVIRHRHPLWRKAEWDDTYRKALSRIRDDQRLFEERMTTARDIVRR
jgi:hypothetical protein